MKKIISIICLSLVTLSLYGANVTLAWNASCDVIVAGYNIYWGEATNTINCKTNLMSYTNCNNGQLVNYTYVDCFSGNYANKISTTKTSLTISNLSVGLTYAFACTTYSAAGAESAMTPEVAYTVPLPPIYTNYPTINLNIPNICIVTNTTMVNLTGISSGNTNVVCSVTASSSNPSIIPNPIVGYTDPNTTATLQLNPIKGGEVTITVTVNNTDASNNSVSATFVVEVGPPAAPAILFTYPGTVTNLSILNQYGP